MRDLHVRDDRGLPAVNGASLTVHAGEIVALAGVDGNGQSELVEAITGPADRSTPASILVGGEDLTTAGARGMVRHGVSHIAEDRQRRGLVLNFTLAENLALREYNTPRACRKHGWLLAQPHARPRRQSHQGVRRPRRRARPRWRPRCRAATSRRSSSPARSPANPRVLVAAQPTRGLDVGAIEFVHRRLVAERDAGRGILLVSLEFEEVRSLADRILVIYEGEIVGEFPPDVSEEELGIAMTRRRAPARGGARERASRGAGQALAGEGGPEAAATTPAARLAAYVQGGGIVVPVLTAVLAFFVGGLVILVTGHNPISTYKAIFNGTGLNWLFPWMTGDERTTAALNLQQTLILTTPLILTGLAVAFAFRCGLFNIGGQGQYLVGLLRRGVGRLVVRRHAQAAPHPARDRRWRRWPALRGRASRAC